MGIVRQYFIDHRKCINGKAGAKSTVWEQSNVPCHVGLLPSPLSQKDFHNTWLSSSHYRMVGYTPVLGTVKQSPSRVFSLYLFLFATFIKILFIYWVFWNHLAVNPAAAHGRPVCEPCLFIVSVSQPGESLGTIDTSYELFLSPQKHRRRIKIIQPFDVYFQHSCDKSRDCFMRTLCMSYQCHLIVQTRQH